MEPVGAIEGGEWNYFGTYSNEEADFMAQLLDNCLLQSELSGGSSFGVPSTFWTDHQPTKNIMGLDEASMYSLDSTKMYCFSQGSNYSGGGSIFFPTSSHESYYPSDSNQILATNKSCMSTDYSSGEVKNTSSPFKVDSFLNKDMSSAHMEESTEEKFNNPLEKSKKRSCNSGDVQKNKRNAKLRKTQKLIPASNNEEDNNAALHRRSSSSYWLDDDSNGSQELNGGVTSSFSSKGAAALNSNGKMQASRGSATDPQSLYARKRRERINERLRILQNLVPNGMKVDISTMLDEAVQYVKFLQLQIKLLSSDDLWVYAPLVYNGMDVGLDLKIDMPRS